MQWCGNAVERRSGKYFGAGTALRQISLAAGGTLTLKRSGKSRRTRQADRRSVYFLAQIAHKRGIWHQKYQKNFRDDTLGPPQREETTPSRNHPQHGYTPCAGAQAPPLLGPTCRSRKPFPQIKIYHYTPDTAVDLNTTVGGCRSTRATRCLAALFRRGGQSGARFTKYPTTILRLSYANAQVTIDLRRTSSSKIILRRAQGFS